MRGLEKKRMGRGQTHKEQINDNTWTLRLLDQLGPEDRVGENIHIKCDLENVTCNT